jgi:cation:H+ antiporter
MSKVIIGATIVSLGTTTPEIFVSVTAAFRGQPDLALGNAVGSIICDTALIFGLCCTLTPLPHDRYILRRQGIFDLGTMMMLTLTLVVLALLHGGIEGVVMPRVVGFAYVGILAVYLWLSVRWGRQHPELVGPIEPGDELSRRVASKAALGNAVVVLVGLGVVAISSDVLIGAISQVCVRYGVPADVLAVTLVALGTSLPELVTALTAVRRGHPELLIGNVIGADILNVLTVTGLSAAAMPLTVAPNFYRLHLPALWLTMMLFGTFIFTSKRTFKRWQGVPLLALYVGYCLTLFILGMSHK